jgi:hypothetical protein
MSLPESLADLGGLLVGFALTILVYSYIFRDNPLYRLAVHLLVGVGAGYAAVVVVRQAILPVLTSLVQEPFAPSSLAWLVPLALAIILILRMLPGVNWLGNSSMAVLIATGASVGLVGAITGTLIPQITAGYENALLGILTAILAAFALITFYFTGRVAVDGHVAMPAWYEYARPVGQFVITVALAGLFAGLLNTSLILLSSRVATFIDGFSRLFETFGS